MYFPQVPGLVSFVRTCGGGGSLGCQILPGDNQPFQRRALSGFAVSVGNRPVPMVRDHNKSAGLMGLARSFATVLILRRSRCMHAICCCATMCGWAAFLSQDASGGSLTGESVRLTTNLSMPGTFCYGMPDHTTKRNFPHFHRLDVSKEGELKELYEF